MKLKNGMRDTTIAAMFIIDILKRLGKSDIQSQIDLIEFMNNEFIKAPIFISIIQSLKELQTIKRNNNKALDKRNNTC